MYNIKIVLIYFKSILHTATLTGVSSPIVIKANFLEEYFYIFTIVYEINSALIQDCAM
jgi:hypothetical protein